jgi:hypothetical protein
VLEQLGLEVPHQGQQGVRWTWCLRVAAGDEPQFELTRGHRPHADSKLGLELAADLAGASIALGGPQGDGHLAADLGLGLAFGLLDAVRNGSVHNPPV